MKKSRIVQLHEIHSEKGEFLRYKGRDGRYHFLDTKEMPDSDTNSVTYGQLVEMRQAALLEPGMLYRITDYECTTTQEGTRSAGHQFDIVVMALDSKTLAERAWAMPHDGDEYFKNSKLEAWQLWYCLDNDTTRFALADTTNGKGVIYRLIDEFNNDIKYDFKNIQFKRTITDGQYDENGTETWCYTLNVWYNNMCQDASIVGNTLPNDEGYISGVYDNVFGYATANDLYLDGVNTFTFVLGDNVMLSFDDDGIYFGIYSNTIGNSFHNNTIGNYFNLNTIGYGFNFNTIGNNFYSNTVGTSVNHLTVINFVRYICVEDNIAWVDITTSATTSSSQYLQNLVIGRGIQGDVSSHKIITHPTTNDTKRTIYVPTDSTEVEV